MQLRVKYVCRIKNTCVNHDCFSSMKIDQIFINHSILHWHTLNISEISQQIEKWDFKVQHIYCGFIFSHIINTHFFDTPPRLLLIVEAVPVVHLFSWSTIIIISYHEKWKTVKMSNRWTLDFFFFFDVKSLIYIAYAMPYWRNKKVKREESTRYIAEVKFMCGVHE